MPAAAHLYHEDFAYYEDRAAGLLASARDGTDSAVRAFAERGISPSEAGARELVAAEHGLNSWAELHAAVDALPGSGAPFLRAYRAVEGRDRLALSAVLDEHPELVRAHGTNGNDLLGMAGATGDERLTVLLLERGADPASANVHGWTALHQAAYSNRTDLIDRLLAAGAPADASARGDGGTPLIIALFWGHREAAAALAAAAGSATAGRAPGNLRVAAGLGDLGLIAALVPAPGELMPAAGAHRGFYRPHSGFPEWQPADQPAEILDEALAWAARSDRTGALSVLVERGARLESDVYRGTALAWAAACGRECAVRELVRLGANPSGLSSFGGRDHGRDLTPLHLAAQANHAATVRALLELGADATVADGLYQGTPADWAKEFGSAEAASLLGAGER